MRGSIFERVTKKRMGVTNVTPIHLVLKKKYIGRSNGRYFFLVGFIFFGMGPFWYQLPVSDDKNILQSLGQQLFHGIFYDLLLGRKGRSEILSCICCFSRASK